jgi:hypothetical protein
MVDFDSVPVCPVTINYRFDDARRLSPEHTIRSMNVVSSIWMTADRPFAFFALGPHPNRAATLLHARPGL